MNGAQTRTELKPPEIGGDPGSALFPLFFPSTESPRRVHGEGETLAPSTGGRPFHLRAVI